MSDEQTALLEGYLAELKAELDNCPAPVASDAVGHVPPFTGDLTEIFHCLQTVYAEGQAGRYGSKALHTHLAQAYGELATKFLADDPIPVGADEAAAINPALIALLIQALPMILDLFRKR